MNSTRTRTRTRNTTLPYTTITEKTDRPSPKIRRKHKSITLSFRFPLPHNTHVSRFVTRCNRQGIKPPIHGPPLPSSPSPSHPTLTSTPRDPRRNRPRGQHLDPASINPHHMHDRIAEDDSAQLFVRRDAHAHVLFPCNPYWCSGSCWGWCWCGSGCWSAGRAA